MVDWNSVSSRSANLPWNTNQWFHKLCSLPPSLSTFTILCVLQSISTPHRICNCSTCVTALKHWGGTPYSSINLTLQNSRFWPTSHLSARHTHKTKWAPSLPQYLLQHGSVQSFTQVQCFRRTIEWTFNTECSSWTDYGLAQLKQARKKDNPWNQMKNLEMADELKDYFASIFTIKIQVKCQKLVRVRKHKKGRHSRK